MTGLLLDSIDCVRMFTGVLLSNLKHLCAGWFQAKAAHEQSGPASPITFDGGLAQRRTMLFLRAQPKEIVERFERVVIMGWPATVVAIG